MNVNDQIALLGYAEMLDDTVDAPGMRGGEPVRILMNEIQRLKGLLEKQWIPVSESIPEDGQSIGFIVDCKRDDFLHGRMYGWRFMKSDYEARFGGFNTHGMSCSASHWFPFPDAPARSA